MKYLLTIAVCMQLFSASAQRTEIRKLVDEKKAELTAFYKHLHQNPELSLQEQNTAKLLATRLKKAGFTVTENFGGFGVVGVFSNGSGPVVMVRTDMDALPIKENTGADYASTKMQKDQSGNSTAVMHACGHDLHMTVWTGVSEILSKLRNLWKGTIIFIAQPAEEIGAGSAAMLKDGLFKQFPVPDYVLALHVNAKMKSGTLGFVRGPVLASVDMIDIKVKGKGGHGGMPNYTIDPIVLSARMILALQTIVSREIEPIEAAVVTVGSIHGGSTGNIIPPEVNLELTIRSLNDDVHHQLISRIRRTINGIALSAGLEEKDFPVMKVRDEFVPFLNNDLQMAQQISDVFKENFGDENVLEIKPEMFGEDFARYGRTEHKIPIFMYSLGTLSAEDHGRLLKGGAIASTHSPAYLPDLEPALQTGLESMSYAILSLLKK